MDSTDGTQGKPFFHSYAKIIVSAGLTALGCYILAFCVDVELSVIGLEAYFLLNVEVMFFVEE